jgi:quercetin 2,3-dioxygenase
LQIVSGDSSSSQARAYLLRSGEGQHYAYNGQLSTLIAKASDTGGLFEAAIVSGGRNSSFPIHQHKRTHEAIFVLDGRLNVLLGETRYRLSAGDFMSIPPGAPHGYQMEDHRTRFVAWTTGGEGSGVYRAIGRQTSAAVHQNSPDALTPERLQSAEDSSDVQFASADSSASQPQGSGDRVPADAVAYTLKSREGERLLAGDQLFTFLAHQRSTNGTFIALATEGPKGDKIGDHFHEKHTETFLCLEGKITMWADGEEKQLFPGDFLHVPPYTVHSYRLDSYHTRFIGFLTPGLFEPFFRTLCEPYDDYIFPIDPHPLRFDRVLQHLEELDLKLVRPPGE